MKSVIARAAAGFSGLDGVSVPSLLIGVSDGHPPFCVGVRHANIRAPAAQAAPAIPVIATPTVGYQSLVKVSRTADRVKLCADTMTGAIALFGMFMNFMGGL